jgi:hypothetical protein
LGFPEQPFYQWKTNPVSDRDYDDAHLINAAIDIHHDDPVRREFTAPAPNQNQL